MSARGGGSSSGAFVFRNALCGSLPAREAAATNPITIRQSRRLQQLFWELGRGKA